MYLTYYNLETKPFQISTDPRFLWMGEKHKEALATLKYGISDNKGFLLLTGDVGTGKTTLINTLINNLGMDTRVAFIPDPGLDKLDFFNYISDAFGLGKRFDTKGEFLAHFTTFLHEENARGKTVLLIIDESQRIPYGILEEIRLLSNIEKQNTKLLNIFFVGQNEFVEILLESRNRALMQRITLNYNIEPLHHEEVDSYIKYRLKVAGNQNRLFNSGAVKEIYLFSKGYPRLINIICDHALLTGYVKEKKGINAALIRECAEELRVPRLITKNTPDFPTISDGRNYSHNIMVATGLIIAFIIVVASGWYLINA